MATSVEQPANGYITLADFNGKYTISNFGQRLTPQEFLAKIEFQDANLGNVTRNENGQIENDFVAANHGFNTNLPLQNELANALYGYSYSQSLLRSIMPQLVQTTFANTRARLTITGELCPTIPPTRFYDPVKTAAFATRFGKIYNATDNQKRANFVDMWNILSFIVRRVAGDVPRVDMVINDFNGTLVGVTNSMLEWPTIPILIDLCTIQDIRAYFERNIDTIRVMLLCLLFPVTDVVSYNSTTSTYTLRDVGYLTTKRTSSRISTNTYDSDRYEYVAKFLQLLNELLLPIYMPVVAIPVAESLTKLSELDQELLTELLAGKYDNGTPESLQRAINVASETLASKYSDEDYDSNVILRQVHSKLTELCDKLTTTSPIPSPRSQSPYTNKRMQMFSVNQYYDDDISVTTSETMF